MAALLSVPSTPPPASYRPPGALDLATALEPFAGSWGTREAAHLYRRAGFGGSPDEIARAVRAGMHAAVDAFVHAPPANALPARPQLVSERLTPEERQTLMANAAAAQNAAPDAAILSVRRKIAGAHRENTIALQRWWLDRMIASPAQLQEKMALY